MCAELAAYRKSKGWLTGMLLGDIEIPEEILTAYDANRLVLFTGAGTSYAAPAGLPSFGGLADGIVEKTNTHLENGLKEWMDRLDVLLGQLDDNPAIDVHELTKMAVTPAHSEPNTIHTSLMRIASGSVPRLVTTNYDLHLEGAAQQLGLEIDTYRGPAMPLGEDFEGIVYLHGAADGPAQQLIVTDRDFGRAYLRDAWASRFLERMFSKYSVLFVGYSHSDVAMKYLGLALGRDTSRYVLTDKPDDALWRRLGITPIPYSPADDHAQLARCLSDWADFSDMDLLDHRSRIQSIVSQPAEPTPGELSYLVESLARPDRVEFFTNAANDLYWLNWAATQKSFRLLFDHSPPAHGGSEASYLLAKWFAGKFALDEARSDHAWSILIKLGGRLSPILWNALAGALHSAEYNSSEPRLPHHRRWLQLLLEAHHPECSTRLLEYALHASQWPDDRGDIIELFTKLSLPQATVEPGDGLLSPTFRIAPLGTAHWLSESWARLIAPNIDELAIEMLPLLERALTHHYRLHETLVTTSYDAFSSRRVSIETEDPNPKNAVDVLVDAARDSLTHLVATESALASLIIDRWLTSPYALVRRLAVHAFGQRGDLTASAKLQQLLDGNLFNDAPCQPEIRTLLSSKEMSEAPAALVDSIVTAARSALVDDVVAQYSSFRILDALREAGAATDSLNSAIDRMIANHPFFLDEEPENGFTFGFVEPHAPMSTADFHDKVAVDPSDAIDFLLGYSDVPFPQKTAPNWGDAVALLADLVRKHPTDGLTVWPHVGGDRELQDTVIQAWAYTADTELQPQIIAALRTLSAGEHLAALGQFFATILREQVVGWHNVPATADLIGEVWAGASADEATANDWVNYVINHPIGHLLDFWLEGVRQAWSAAGQAWTGLRGTDLALMSAVLDDDTRTGAIALTQLAGHLHFLDAADNAWCRGNLLPRHDWGAPATAEPFWWGALTSGRWNSGLLGAGLLDGLTETAAELERFGKVQQRRWADFSASVALRAELPDTLQWIRALTTTASEPHRVELIDSLTQFLGELPQEGKRAAWENWMASYWEGRVNNVPIVLSLSEASSMAAWAVHLPAVNFEAAVELATTKSAGLDEYGDVAEKLLPDLITQRPGTVGKFLFHLMTNTKSPFWGQDALEPVLTKLTQQPGDWKALKGAALGLGITLA
ncbi:DUF4020 domain-containing protein [Kribbella sp. NPDC051587]|uniref:DUF4020 domain-containing protein n=1 Tax=Kribbella sp. NPDC051587 TaxID=3364119 RepID=UPI0037BB5CFD